MKNNEIALCSRCGSGLTMYGPHKRGCPACTGMSDECIELIFQNYPRRREATMDAKKWLANKNKQGAEL